MESLGLSQKDAQSRNKWRKRIKGQPANPGSPGKMAVRTVCVCVCMYVSNFDENPFPVVTDKNSMNFCYSAVTLVVISESHPLSALGISPTLQNFPSNTPSRISSYLFKCQSVCQLILSIFGQIWTRTKDKWLSYKTATECM